DRADARLAGGELAPVLLAAGPERGHDADAGDDDDGAPRLVPLGHRFFPHSTASIRARPSPRQCPPLVTTPCRSGVSISRSAPDESQGGYSFPRWRAIAASAILAGNCGSSP